MKRSHIIPILVALPLVVGVGVLVFILVQKNTASPNLPDIETFEEYKEGFSRVTEEGREARYDVQDHEDKNIQRVVDNVNVKITKYETPEEAQKQITDASLVYIWGWKREIISGREVSTGYFFNTDEGRYEKAYLAWVDGSIYYELIVLPKELRGFSDKQFLFESAKEVAEVILSEANKN